MRTDAIEQTTAVAAKPIAHIPWTVLRPGFWRSRRAIKRFKRFQNLVIHHERWGSHIDTVPPLAEVIGKKAAKQNAEAEIERHMNLLAIPVILDLNVAQVGHTVVVTTVDKERTYSLITDFFRFPDHWYRRKFEALMQRLDMAIGLYEARKWQAVRNWFNPMFWMACVVRVPEIVLEHAGLIRTSDQHSAFLGVYKWFVRVVFLVTLTVGVTWLAKKLGLNLPWDLLTKVLSS